MRTLLLTTALAGSLFLHAQDKSAAPAKPVHPLAEHNLLKDPGAEAKDPVGMAAWSVEGTFADKPGRMAAETYGQTPGVFAKGWGAKNGHGDKYFRFWCDARTEVRTLSQRIDLTELGDTIDQRRAVGRIVGFMAAIGNPHFKGSVVVEYRNADDKPLQTLRTRNVPYDVQGTEWKLTRCSESGVIPPGTRFAVVYLSAYFDADGDATGSFVMDDVSFELFIR